MDTPSFFVAAEVAEASDFPLAADASEFVLVADLVVFADLVLPSDLAEASDLLLPDDLALLLLRPLFLDAADEAEAPDSALLSLASLSESVIQRTSA